MPKTKVLFFPGKLESGFPIDGRAGLHQQSHKPRIDKSRIFLKKSIKTAELLNLQHQTWQGRKDYIQKLIHGPWGGVDFVNIPSGKDVNEGVFIFQPT